MVREVEYLSVGGGIGSFCWYNCLRIHGIPTEKIAVISPHKKPYHQFKKYCDAIGLTKNERLRSDSGSRPDNFWGFPGYGLSEALESAKALKLLTASKLMLQLLIEPFYFGYYSPTAGRVYKALDREAKRIGWQKSLVRGYATGLTRLADGRFMVNVKPKNSIVARVVHLSLGHGSIRKKGNALPAYEMDKKSWKQIKENAKTVAVIGRGTAAQKVVSKLLDIKNIQVISIHKNSNPLVDSRGLRQKNYKSWRLQQFNWPKGAFGGGLSEELDPSWGSPSATPDKKWLRKIKMAILTGRYQITTRKVAADLTIDCSGFNERATTHRLYSNLVKKYSLPLANGFIKTNKFGEIETLCSYKGRVYVAGAALGSSQGPVDSFFGQQYAAYKTLESLNIKRLDLISSLEAWHKWVFNKKI